MTARAWAVGGVLGLVSGLALALCACGSSTNGPAAGRAPGPSPSATAGSSASAAPSAGSWATGQPAAAAQASSTAAEQPAAAGSVWGAGELAALAAETDPAKWKPRVRLLLQQRLDDKLDEVALFPHLGGLRDKLLAVMDEPESQLADRRGFSRGSVARSLLALWSDPRDSALVTRWLAENKRFAEAAPPGLTGSTIEQALAKWRDYHFTREGFANPAGRTANWLSTKAATDEHALCEHHVRYKHWGYTMELVLTKAQGLWAVRVVMHTMHEDYE
jgi:hypothetical protein